MNRILFIFYLDIGDSVTNIHRFWKSETKLNLRKEKRKKNDYYKIESIYKKIGSSEIDLKNRFLSRIDYFWASLFGRVDRPMTEEQSVIPVILWRH